MAITSSDIDNASFSTERKGGYSVEEVDLFLERVSNEVGALNQEVATLEKQGKSESGELFEVSKKEKEELLAKIALKDQEIENLKKEVKERTSDSKAISEALIVAQRAADKIIADARDKADKIVQDAKDRSDYIAKDTENKKNKVMSEIAKLEGQHARCKKEYEEMLSDIIDKTNKHLTESKHSSGPLDGMQAAATGTIKKTGHHVNKASVATGVTSANNPVSAPKPNPQTKPQKDFSGYGDAVFGDDKID